MNISEVSISFVKPYQGIIGFASLVLDDKIYLSGIGIHQKRDGTGYRLTYPTRKTKTQNFDIFHPINKQASHAIETAVFQKLKDVEHESRSHAGHNSDQSYAP